MTTRHPVMMIAAVARNGVIGHAGHMPWTLPGDLAHFRAATTGRPVLMGRKTFAAIGRPLPGRSTIVLSGDPDFNADGIVVEHTLAEALARGDQEADRLGADSLMVAGGATLYAALIDQARTLLITEVAATPDGDTRFPPVDLKLWEEMERRSGNPQPGDTASYSFVRFERRSSL